MDCRTMTSLFVSLVRLGWDSGVRVRIPRRRLRLRMAQVSGFTTLC